MSVESNPATPPTAPAPTQPAVSRDMSQPPVGAPVPTAQTIPLTVPEYQRLISVEAELARYRAEQQAALDAKEAEKAKALAEKGQVEEGLKLATSQWEKRLAEMTLKYDSLESSLLTEKKAATLSAAFAGRTFAGDTPEQQAVAAGQLRQLLEAQYEAVRDAAGQIVVREKASLRPAADAVKEALASPLYAHFFAPSSRGGTGSDASRPPANTAKADTFEQFAEAYRKRVEAARQASSLH